MIHMYYNPPKAKPTVDPIIWVLAVVAVLYFALGLAVGVVFL